MDITTSLDHGRHGFRGPTPLLRLQGDDRLIALTRRGSQAAYEALVARYQSRLLAFCRRMLGSREDAEDVLQEVFAAAFHAMHADDRPINARPWLYRIARNRCLNHLRRQTAVGVDSMDIHLAEHGTTTADKVHKREEFRELVEDVQQLAETQRTALLLREIGALSYDQIAETMETTVPSVKSLLVRARVSLAEASEARLLTCDAVREELAEVAEGLARSTPPTRRHVRQCESCAAFKKHLRRNDRALAALAPVGPLLLLKNLLTHGAAGTAGTAGAASVSGVGAGGVSAGGALTAGLTALGTKAAAGLTAAALVTAGAVEVDHVRHLPARPAPAIATTPSAPVIIASAPQDVPTAVAASHVRTGAQAKDGTAEPAATPRDATPTATVPVPTATPTAAVAAPTTLLAQPGADIVGLPGTDPMPPVTADGPASDERAVAPAAGSAPQPTPAPAPQPAAEPGAQPEPTPVAQPEATPVADPEPAPVAVDPAPPAASTPEPAPTPTPASNAVVPAA